VKPTPFLLAHTYLVPQLVKVRVCVSMEATAVALWVERIAFLLLSCFTSIESCGFGWGAVLGLLALSNFLFRCAMEEKASAVKLKKLHKNLKNSDSRVSSLF